MLPCRLENAPVRSSGETHARARAISNLILTHWSRYHPSMLMGCELLPTRYDELAQALGCLGYYAANGSEVRNGLESAWNSKKPSCINVEVGRVAAPIIKLRSSES